MVYAHLFLKQCFVAKKFKKRWYWAILAVWRDWDKDLLAQTNEKLPKLKSFCLSLLGTETCFHSRLIFFLDKQKGKGGLGGGPLFTSHFYFEGILMYMIMSQFLVLL